MSILWYMVILDWTLDFILCLPKMWLIIDTWMLDHTSVLSYLSSTRSRCSDSFPRINSNLIKAGIELTLFCQDQFSFIFFSIKRHTILIVKRRHHARKQLIPEILYPFPSMLYFPLNANFHDQFVGGSFTSLARPQALIHLLLYIWILKISSVIRKCIHTST